MALDKDVLTQLIKSKIEAVPDYPVPGQSPIFQDIRIIEAISDAIITHFKAAAEILPGTFEVDDPDSGTLPVTGEGTMI